ncbi:MAG: 16S rRNA (guanine(527)-N(7))-methyltransferase RsmG [Lachnospiraceae bacterium]|jgi:16S rRNA (guanine527-N7)-methyltransferase
MDVSVLEKSCRELGIALSEQQKKQFIQYYELLTEWNKVMNLTGITQWEEVQMKHFVDSLSIVKGMDMSQIHTLVDVGTGAGFPGVPIKIVFPHIRVVLLDSLNKRLKFLQEVIDQLSLKEIETVHGRAEDIAKKPEYRDRFDLSVSRAVSRLCSLSEYCLPFVRQGGYFVSYKGGKAEEEIQESKKAISVLGGKLERVIEFSFEDQTENIERSLVMIKKIKATPKKYPRKAGLPTKEPIL